MSRKTCLFVVVALAASVALACGDDNPPIDIGGGDEGILDTLVPDEGTDTNIPDTGKDVGGEDIRPDVQPDTVDPDVNDVQILDVQSDVESDAVDAMVDNYVEPMCPCDETVNEPVCGVDEVTYTSATCAACTLCAEAADCVGCTGDIVCDTSGSTNFLLRRTSCDECPCNLEDECTAQVQPLATCGQVCGIDGETQYSDLCDLKEKNHCPAVLDDLIGYFGVCLEPVCEPCEGIAEAKVCGSDGHEYKNKCELNNCPVAGEPGSVTIACAQECPCP